MAQPTTDQRGQLQRRGNDGAGATLIALVQKMAPEIEKALPRHITADRMARMAMTAIRSTRDLARCDAMSFAGCLMQCAQLGLEPNTPLGQAYLIPRNIKGQMQCTLIVGYQGMMDLARRSGQVHAVQARAVFTGDEFAFEYGSVERLHHVPAGDEDPDRLTHTYGIARLEGGAVMFEVATRKAIEAARARGGSDRGTHSPWRTDYIAMAQKTAIRKLYKWLPKSAEIARAIMVDENPERQAALFSPEVHEALHSHGFEVPNEEQIDPETGEVIETKADASKDGVQ